MSQELQVILGSGPVGCQISPYLTITEYSCASGQPQRPAASANAC